MYTVEVSAWGDTLFRTSVPEMWEPTWMAAGLDLISLHGAPAEVMERDAWYARETLKGSKDYYLAVYPDHYEDVLHFLDRLLEAGQEWPEGTVEVTY